MAARLGVRSVTAKLELSRFGLPAFKMLGASWATYRCVSDTWDEPHTWTDIAELRALTPSWLGLTTATDGNHGRAVAHMAEMLGLNCTIFVPHGTASARVNAIASHGAVVVEVGGDYDAAVMAARDLAATDTNLRIISDTSWPGYHRIPADVIDGYSTIFAEIGEAIAARSPVQATSSWFVQTGVGALLAAAVTATEAEGPLPRAELVCVEPWDADCVLRTARSGQVVAVPGPHTTLMAGLNCGTPSEVAIGRILAGTSTFVSVDDDACREAIRLLAASGVDCGETGAAGLAGALALADDGHVDASAQIGLIVTEGVTDPPSFEAIVGRAPRQ